VAKKKKDVKVLEQESKAEAPTSRKLVKRILTCTNSKCKYTKKIIKKELSERDLICPRCKKKMKVKII